MRRVGPAVDERMRQAVTCPQVRRVEVEGRLVVLSRERGREEPRVVVEAGRVAHRARDLRHPPPHVGVRRVQRPGGDAPVVQVHEEVRFVAPLAHEVRLGGKSVSL